MRLKFITAISYSSLYCSDVWYPEINSPSNTFPVHKNHHPKKPTPTPTPLQKRLQQRMLEVLLKIGDDKKIKLSDKKYFYKAILTF